MKRGNLCTRCNLFTYTDLICRKLVKCCDGSYSNDGAKEHWAGIEKSNQGEAGKKKGKVIRLIVQQIVNHSIVNSLQVIYIGPTESSLSTQFYNNSKRNSYLNRRGKSHLSSEMAAGSNRRSFFLNFKEFETTEEVWMRYVEHIRN